MTRFKLYQLKYLLCKNILYKKNNKKSTCFEIFNNLFFSFIIGVYFYVGKTLFNKQDNVVETGLSETIDINNFLLETGISAFYSNKYVGFVIPENTEDQLLPLIKNNKIFNGTVINPLIFQNDKYMETYHVENPSSLLTGIIIDKDLLSYTIRIDGSILNDSNDSGILIGEQSSNNLTPDNTYLSIFAPLQIAVEQALLNMNTNNTEIDISFDFGTLPNINNNNNNVNLSFMEIGSISLNILLFMMYSDSILENIVSENESNIKSYLKMIGVVPSTLGLSWLITEMIYYFILSFTMCLAYLICKVFKIKIIILLFILFCIFSFSISSFILFTSTFFKEQKTASSAITMIILIFTLSHVLIFFTSQSIKIFVSIFLSPASLAMAMERLIIINKTKMVINPFTDKDIIISSIILIWNTLFYFTLYVISENLFSEGNLKFFKLSNKQYKNKNNICNSDNYHTNKDIESYLGNENSCIEVKEIFKEFKNQDTLFLALNNISFKAYKNEIFCLLGHNGAGKSTLFKIITGYFSSNHGSVYFDNQEYQNDLQNIRNNTGICSQENILFEGLTVKQNLIVFMGLKNVKGDSNLILKKVGLLNKTDTKVKHLSGGQKRKLCIAIAISGNPKYLFLDEPTTGLDPVSRREIWNLLTEIKKDKIIILTTHYMDEADILADRKLILINGKIRCLGTSVFLKNHFNMMYSLKVQTDCPDQIDSIINKIIPSSIYIESTNNQNDKNSSFLIREHSFEWKLPMSTTLKFKTLFGELNKPLNKKLYEKYSLISPSLEELFIKLTEESYSLKAINNNEEEGNHYLPQSLNEKNNLLIHHENSYKNESSLNFQKLPDTEKLKTSSILLLLIKLRYKIYFRNKLFLLYMTLFPLIGSLAVFIFLNIKNVNKLISLPKQVLSPSSFYPNDVWNFNIEKSNLRYDFFTRYSSKLNYEFNNLTNFENHFYFENNKNKSYICSISGNVTDNTNSYEFDVYYNKTKRHAIPLIINHISNDILKNIVNDVGNNTIKVTSHPFPYYNILNDRMISLISNMIIGFILVFTSFKYGMQVVKERKDLIVKQLNLNRVNNKAYWLSILITDFSFFFVTELTIFISGLLLKFSAFTGIIASFITIVTIILSSFSSLLFQYCLSFMFNNPTTAYSLMPIVNMVFIFIGFILGYIPMISNVKNNNIDIYSFFFNKNSIYAKTILSVLYPPFGFINVIEKLDSINILNRLNEKEYPLNLSNYLSLDKGISGVIIGLLISILIYFILLIYLDKNYNSVKCNENEIDDSKYNQNKCYKESLKEDVKSENNLVKMNYKNFPLSILKICKEYEYDKKPNPSLISKKSWNYNEVHRSVVGNDMVKTVLEDISFHVNPNECFGLLGPNGVGKSTLLNMLIGLSKPTLGNIYYNGNRLNKNSNILIGYCNQFDILWEKLTIKEHVEFFLKLRGFPHDQIGKYASQYIKYCNLEDHQNKRVYQLSGGTKRKLSVLLALCANPKYIILDEPTAGMDPYTRRFTWDVIKSIKNSQSSSIIMTTHSMEEAEALCDRLTILNKGILNCIGSPEFLTLTYAKDYIVEISSNNPEQIHEKVFNNPTSILFNINYKLEKESTTRYKYFIPKEHNLSDLFELFEKAKFENEIKDYLITESSLDDVFINFTIN